MTLIAWSRAYRPPTAAGSDTQRSRFMHTTPPSHITDNSRWILLSHCLPVASKVLICVSPAAFTAPLLSKTKTLGGALAHCWSGRALFAWGEQRRVLRVLPATSSWPLTRADTSGQPAPVDGHPPRKPTPPSQNPRPRASQRPLRSRPAALR